jgi:hypothetical protein
MSINQIVTPLDSAVLDSKAHYTFYHQMLDFVFKELVVTVQREAICKNEEVALFKQYSDLLLYTINAMRTKYMYDDEDNMKVDLTASGFPNYLEFRYLYNDLELREEYLGKLTPIDTLKSEFLDTLMRKKQPVKRSKLFQAASIVYYSSVKKQYIFNRFVQGKITNAPKGNAAQYMTSWSFYDVSKNRPFICFMYFNYDGSDVQEAKHKIYEVLKATADRDMPIDTMAYAIDKRLPKVFPKHIKRLDLGPIHNMFAKDDNIITHTLLDGISKKELPLESYAVSLKVTEVVSKSEFKEGRFFNKQILQRWDLAVTKRYVLAPHRIIQLLYNKTPELINDLAKPPIEIARVEIEL